MFSVAFVAYARQSLAFSLNRESWSFPFNFDIARRYAEHLDYQTSRYGEQSFTLYFQLKKHLLIALYKERVEFHQMQHK